MTFDRSWLIHRYDRVASTMDQAAALARAGVPDRTVVVSTEQTAGRGRSGRSWAAPAGTSLFCTLVLRPAVAAERLSTLPLVVGVAVAEAIEVGLPSPPCPPLPVRREVRVVRDHPHLEPAIPPIQLKWPNDVWMGADPDNRKVAGILLTSRLHGSGIDYVLVGIGVNVSSTAEDLPAGATSIRVASGASTTPDGLLETLLARFDRVYANYLAALGRPSLDSWRARAALIGEHVVVADGGQQVDGKFLGIDDDGALLLQESDATVRRIVAGNVTRGPRETGQSSGS